MINTNYEAKRSYFEFSLQFSSISGKLSNEEMESLSYLAAYHYQIGFKEGLEYAQKHRKKDIEKGLECLSGFGDVVEF